MGEEKTIRIRYIKSAIGRKYDQKQTIEALGLRRLQQVVEHRDTPSVRGMVRKVFGLVRIEEETPGA